MRLPAAVCSLKTLLVFTYQIEKKGHGFVLMGAVGIEASSSHNGPCGLVKHHHVNPSSFIRLTIL